MLILCAGRRQAANILWELIMMLELEQFKQEIDSLGKSIVEMGASL